ncbi:MAG: DUF2092 domain-containing protein [Candidatus Latescibacterota bacterium]|nr:MAG: DUF2092 domain-containing protein [Candidatus Latescibacterota bacterium]
MNDQCQDIREKIASALVDDVLPTDWQTVETHLAECPGCRQYQEDLLEDDQLLTSFVESAEQTVSRLEGQIMESIENTQVDAPAAGPRISADGLWRWTFQSRLIKAAAAAVVVLGIVFAINLFDRGSGSNAVWARVIKQVEDAKDFICRVSQDNSSSPDLDMVKYHSTEFGERTDIYRRGSDHLAAAQYLRQDDNTMYVIIHRDKSYALVELNEKQMAEMTRSSAKELVELFRSYEFEEIGERTIDGVKAIGIEVKNPEIFAGVFDKSQIRLWVDRDTEWPVKIEYEAEGQGGKVRTNAVMHDFQWNPALGASDFEFEIPSDYKMIGQVEAVKNDQAGAIDGFRDYADFAGGRYPSKLTVATAIHDVEDEISRRRRDGELGKDDMTKFMRIQNACAFFAELDKENKDPAYYGDKVGPRDFDKVLMRWRIDDGQYRVVYGDLRVEDVDAARLGELEDQ